MFDYVADGARVVTLGNPLAVYQTVTSKFNQPRGVGTNPHRGTDLRASYGTAVYAPWNGWVVYAATTDLELRLDINQDGVANDNAFFRYDHLSSIRRTSGLVTKGEWVANSGDENGTTVAHLHFGVKKDNNGTGLSDVWVHNEPYYRGIAAWDDGRLLDFVSNATWNSTADVAAIYCYAADEVSQNESIAQGDVMFFHRPDAPGAWSSTVGIKNGNQFYVDLTGRYPRGTSINWMARCNRTSKKTTINPYWAFEPPKFAQPAYDPNSTAETYSFFGGTLY